MRVLARPRRLPSIACMTQIGVPAAKDTPPGDDGAANTLSASGSGRLGAILRYDLPASLVVFLVALPLSLGIAVASGAPPLAGLIAAIVGGVVAGLLGGSPLQVSGPAAGLTVIVAGLVAEFGWKVTCAITVCAGLLQIVFGLTRLGRAALAISPMVVHAMLAGIGITIALQQVHVLLGGETHSSAVHNLVDLPVHLTHAQLPGMWLGLLVIAIMVGWRWVPAAVRVVPGPLVGIVAATAASVLLALDVPRIELNGSLIDALQLPALPDGKWGAFAVGVLTVALIASVESLLTAVAVDRMQTHTRSNLDRELVGQGAANMVSGAAGGLPITGVIVRSSANVTAGARTRASNILHGVWVLVFALPFAGLVQQIPTAALAGLLVVIGVQLVKISHIKTARRNGDLAVYVVTVAGVVFINLLIGVLLGLALSILMTVWRVAHARITAEQTGPDTWRVIIDGACTFLSLPRLHQALESVPSGTAVTLMLSPSYMDHATEEYLESWQRGHEAAGGTVSRSTRTSGREPRTLFITCTDSDIAPSAVTGARPGDLLIVRNIGNLVPAGRLDPSVEAAIAYAVRKLGVTSVVVCGHSGCDAMTELLDGRADDADGQLRSWLAHAETARAAFRNGSHPLARTAAAEGFDTADQLGIVNVAVQADIVAQHPLIRDPHDQGDLDVVGLFYDTSGQRVLQVNAAGARRAEQMTSGTEDFALVPVKAGRR